MNQANKFDLCFRDRGGRYPDEIVTAITNGNSLTTSVLIPLRNLVVSRKIIYPKVPEIYVGLINHDRFYVAARKFEDLYFIGISVGAMDILFQIFNQMMANGKVLTQFGDSRNEDAVPGMLSAEIFDAEILREENEGNLKTPNDPIRGNMAFLFTLHALSFLLMHEWGHIANGHLDLKIAMRGVPSISEVVGNFESPGLSRMDLQTLEMDADSTAFNQTFAEIITYHIGMRPLNPDFQPFFENFETAVFLLYFSTHVLLRCHAIPAPKVDHLANLSHPPAGIRMFQVQSSIITKFDAILNRSDIPEFAKRLSDIALEAENAMNLISKEVLRPVAFVNAFRLPFQKLSVEYMVNWKNMRPRLEPFTFRELPAIQPEFEDYLFDNIPEVLRN